MNKLLFEILVRNNMKNNMDYMHGFMLEISTLTLEKDGGAEQIRQKFIDSAEKNGLLLDTMHRDLLWTVVEESAKRYLLLPKVQKEFRGLMARPNFEKAFWEYGLAAWYGNYGSSKRKIKAKLRNPFKKKNKE